jgi:hypothetical protein
VALAWLTFLLTIVLAMVRLFEVIGTG